MKLSILIPSRVEPNIVRMLMETEECFPGAEIIVAQDRDSRGKGWAIRTALEQATGDIICFIDADLDIHPRMIFRLIPFIDDYDIVVGTKGLTGIPSRKILTWLSRWYIRFMFGLSVDTQTGIKMFHVKHLPNWKTDGFCFDVEILAKAQRNGSRMIEVPIEAVHSKKMAAKSVLKTLKESIKIWLALKSR
jgi:glycosyltransferase involved in cell wall biosynthesis